MLGQILMIPERSHLCRIAVEHEAVKTVAFLLKNGCKINYPVVKLACERHLLKILGLLIVMKAEINSSESRWSALMVCAESNSLSCGQLLIKSKADINQYIVNESPLTISISKYNHDFTQLLINSDADLDPKLRYTPLLAAFLHSNFEAATSLLEARCDVDMYFKGVNALKIA